jgi:hypothetical protein
MRKSRGRLLAAIAVRGARQTARGRYFDTREDFAVGLAALGRAFLPV